MDHVLLMWSIASDCSHGREPVQIPFTKSKDEPPTDGIDETGSHKLHASALLLAFESRNLHTDCMHDGRDWLNRGNALVRTGILSMGMRLKRMVTGDDAWDLGVYLV